MNRLVWRVRRPFQFFNLLFQFNHFQLSINHHIMKLFQITDFVLEVPL